ncbi:MAG: GAF domain-containing protein [Verrucomicrobia bacterium]|nr:GAF domain-containing protein [Verrucomicrobiota bacterium]
MHPTPKHQPPEASIRSDDSRSARAFILILVVLAADIVASGYYYYRYQARQVRATAEQQLLAIDELRVSELTQWRNERLGDGGILFKNAAFADLVRRFLEQPEDPDAPPQLRSWIDKYGTHFRYDEIRLLDTHGQTRLSSPAGLAVVSPVVAEHAAAALRTGQLELQDFFRSTVDGKIRLALLVPIFDEADGQRPLGVIVMRIDPAAYLYPLISRWPVPSETAETLLVRREGNEVVFLNELRFQASPALTMRISLANTTMPVVKAVLGQEGIVAGRDYRGVPVLAAVHAVPDSPWFMVTLQDVREVVAPLRTQLWQVIAMVGVLLLGTGAGLGLVWRRQRVRHYRKQAQAAEVLHENEMKYRTLFETANDAILLFTDDRWVDCNTATLRIFGCTREQFIGAHPSRFSPPLQPDGRSSAEEAIEKIHLAYTVGPQVFDWEHCRADGAPFAADVHLNRLELGGKPYVQAIVRDISERKQAAAINAARLHLIEFSAAHSLDELLEETLNEAEKLSGSVIGFCHFVEDDQTTLTLQNWSTRTKAEFCRAEGKGSHYAIDMAGVWVDCLHERKPVIHNDYASLPHRKGMPEGHAVVVRQLVVPVMQGEKVVAILGVGNKPADYTSLDVAVIAELAELAWQIAGRKRTEETLQKIRALLTQAERLGKVGGWEFDLETRRQTWTEMVYEIHELDFTGQPTVDQGLNFYTPASRPIIEQAVQHAIERGEPFDVELEIITAKGNLRSVHAIGKADPARRKVAGFFQDITERKQVEAELQAKSAELERFLHAVSHDLKSPAVTIQTFLGFLAQDLAATDAGRIEKDLRFIHAATDKMMRMLDELLELARVGRVGSRPVKVTFRELVDEALGAVAGRIAERGVTVAVGEHAVSLLGERLRLAEIWQNLIENACKFMGDQPAPRIEIGLEMRGAETVFFVRDNGIGLDPRHHARIFNLFEKLDPSAEGTGLGLALIKRIVDLYQGRIWVASPGKGQGTCFHFTLPAALQQDAPMPSP